MTSVSPPKCTSRPDCPCDFCTGLRVKAFCNRRDREMDAERAEENQLAEDFLRLILCGSGPTKTNRGAGSSPAGTPKD
jgi:hypothetical protein